MLTCVVRHLATCNEAEFVSVFVKIET